MPIEPPSPQRDIATLAKGGRTNIAGFALRLAARLPFLFIAGRLYGPDRVGRFALAIVVVELAALVATLGLKRGLAQALSLAGDRPHAWIVWDALAVAAVAAMLASGVLLAVPGVMYPAGGITPVDRLLPCIIVASAWSDISLAALAYRHDVTASVRARAIVEPWTISIAAWLFHFATIRDGLVLSYIASMVAALIASAVPLVKTYGLPRGWTPQLGPLFALGRANAPLAAADAIEWGTRNLDRLILGLFFAPAFVGVYYMAQQVASLPQKLKTSFDPILGPVVTQSLAAGDRAGVARQVRQVAFWIIAAQGCLALMGTVPAPAVMGTVGPQFVAGSAALGFLLTAEVLASTGAVSESVLVYVARGRNLAISGAMLAVQVALSVALIALMRSWGWPRNWQAAGPAVALLLSVTVTSLVKARVLGRLLGASVWPWRWPLLAAATAGLGAGLIALTLPHRLEWAELSFGEPAIAGAYLLVLWRRAFSAGDRALFGRAARVEEATLPLAGMEPAAG